MGKKQTPVEWLFQQLWDEPKDKFTWYAIREKALKMEQEKDSNWFNEYQKVEDYIIDKIGDKFLEATPEKYKTASEATIALLENNWQQERMYSEEEVKSILKSFVEDTRGDKSWVDADDEWFEQFKKK